MRSTALVCTVCCTVALLSLTGCRDPRKVRPDDPRYPVLEELSETGRELKPTVKAGLPLSFGPVEIESEKKRKTTYYTATLSWEPAGEDGAVGVWLKQRVAAKRPGLTRGALANTFTVVLTYKDKEGETCASETVEVAVQRPRGSATLNHLGDEGTVPHSIVATPVRSSGRKPTWWCRSCPAGWRWPGPGDGSSRHRRRPICPCASTTSTSTRRTLVRWR
jgi:hypothetical protein